MAVKSFADSSIVRLSVVQKNVKDKADVGGGTYELINIPFTTESFKVTKESKMSTAIRGDRRPSESRNIKGSASGGFSFEVNLNSFFTGMVLPAALMNSYVTQDSSIEIGAPILSNKVSNVIVDGPTVTGYESTTNSIKVVKSVSDTGVLTYADAKSVTAYNAVKTAGTAGTYFCVTTSANNITAGAQTVTTDTVSFVGAKDFDAISSEATITFTVKVAKIADGVVTEKVSQVIQTITPLVKSATVDKTKVAYLNHTAKAIGLVKGMTSQQVALSGSIHALDGTTPATPGEWNLTVQQKVGSTVSTVYPATNLTSATINLPSLTVDGLATRLSLTLKKGTVVHDVVEVPLIVSTQLNKYLIDGTTLKPWIVEKYELSGNSDGYSHYIGQYFGTCINEMTLDFADGDFVKASVTTLSTSYDYYKPNAPTSSDRQNSDIASDYRDATQDSLLDTTNSIKSIVLKDANGDVIPAVFSTASLKISNNLREQAALGSQFMAGVGVGKVNATLTGEIYFYDNTLLEKHLANEKVSAVIELNDSNEAVVITLPRLAISAPSNNAQGENQDYKTSLTFTAEPAVTETEKGYEVECVILVEYKNI